MIEALKMNDDQDEHYDHSKKATVDLKSLPGKHLQHFVKPRSMKLFQMMDLPHGFLDVDLDVWHGRDDYKHAREKLQSLRVVNDQAECDVALIQEYSGLLTKNETQLQFLLQVVEEHRRLYPDSRKQTLTNVP